MTPEYPENTHAAQNYLAFKEIGSGDSGLLCQVEEIGWQTWNVIVFVLWGRFCGSCFL